MKVRVTDKLKTLHLAQRIRQYALKTRRKSQIQTNPEEIEKTCV